ncbi:hypothetical protein GCM10009818_00150 [Nakamurella flavida]
MTNTFSAFTAAITNTVNTAATGTLILQETSGATVCNSNDSTGANSANTINTNAATCATINKYGGSTTMVPSASNTTPTNVVTTNIAFRNTGTAAAASFTLTPGVCAQTNNGAINGSATDFCAKLRVSITSGATVVYTGTAAALTAPIVIPASLIPAPAPGGAAVPFVVSVFVDATAGNTYQGLSASQTLLWTLSS